LRALVGLVIKAGGAAIVLHVDLPTACKDGRYAQGMAESYPAQLGGAAFQVLQGLMGQVTKQIPYKSHIQL